MTQEAIHFATIAAGGGHVATARAMMEAVERQAPGAFRLSMSDLMLELGLTDQDRRHKASWRWMLARPWTARLGQHALDALPRLTVAAQRHMLDETARRASRRFAAERPALIVANHPWLTVALTRSRRRYGLKTPVLTFATEPLDASALWAEGQAEHFVVPSAAAMNDLERMGVSPAKIDVVGYPVAQRFLNPLEQRAARRELGLAARFTLLLSLGGEGVAGDAGATVRGLLAALPEAQIVVMTGRNESLRARLRELADPPRLHAVGFTDRVADYLSAADVVAGKAGPASVFEALAVGRPVLVTSYAGLNEREIVRFLERKGLGAYLPRLGALARRVRELED
ncbi:MAG: glycosyltransferase, partial [Deinococcota bacterium]|nr:glycosyltransferase [Deinococcota bacterium]